MPPHFLTPLLFAGTLWAVPAHGSAEADLATWLASKPGTLHAAPDHPWLQEVTFHTRLHWQYAWVSGRSGGSDFWYESGGEVRRFYFGPTVRFLDLFTLKADANLVADDSPGGGDLKFGYDSMFELYLSADLRRFIDSPAVDSFKLSYGRREQQLTEEHHPPAPQTDDRHRVGTHGKQRHRHDRLRRHHRLAGDARPLLTSRLCNLKTEGEGNHERDEIGEISEELANGWIPFPLS